MTRQMQLLLSKFKNSRGESLAEVLVAILIIALSSAMFLSMTMASAKINRSVQTSDDTYYAAMSLLEKHTAGNDSNGTEIVKETGGSKIEIVWNGSSAIKETVPVNLYTGDKMVSYGE